MESLILPSGSTAVDVSVINTTRMTIPAHHPLAPPDGLYSLTLDMPSYSFVIAHPSGRKMLFDLGLRKDWCNLPPATLGFLEQVGWQVEAAKNVSEVLQEGGTSLSDIEAVIWSHHHFDHVGDMTAFPLSTKLVVGPGFKKHYAHAFPSNPESSLWETAWNDRELQEVSFDSSSLDVGPFKALDYFGDGSFYLLDSPGHTVGHLAALAHVTVDGQWSSNSFVLMAGDTCHFIGQFRPTVYRPLSAEQIPECLQQPLCPGTIMERLLACPSQPLFGMPEMNAVDISQAYDSIEKLQVLDSADNVWVIVAHDQALLDQIEFYPATINDWQKREYAEKTRWRFWNTLKPHGQGH
ncbi:MBL fold metallo-hydrolase [Aspergillus puulaauensis]|uniref:Metallo-beta-lactamase domain-containing protein n=1 Tax=Aspergillus puulaauensis TaxID=1220207 RepID=A0A7R7XST5_9EURO|nr:uncharacterized protein APUU_51642S [Aspergillus puulaauensis]BCS26931.1 hypothetical protein APUU_51642S [Aspergillus puulaauensis]